MRIEKIYPSGFAANTYAVTADGIRAVVVDPAQPRVADELKKRGLVPAYVLLTHAHFDHTGGVAELQKAGAKVVCTRTEKETVVGKAADLSEAFGASRAKFTVDKTAEDGEELCLCGLSVKVIAAPGHTAGGACYLIGDERGADGGNKALFTGDTLFAGGVGRTDFPTGDAGELRSSLRRLKNLDGDYPVYPGHEEDTTLERERKENPFLIDA